MERIARSMNAELIEGATDAAIKKERPDTVGGAATSSPAREVLFRGKNGYGFNPAPLSYVRRIISGVVRGT